ncbi:hypothetical protein BT69DRAFT_1275359 [Atractiella rhizophila]|nr:hypothetical protein BT69DRAFT_1275359 [Atractiella rhizophila]
MRKGGRESSTLSSRRGPKPRFSRSKKGCSTCRKRHVKCGEEKPDCINCARLYLDCVYGNNPKATPPQDREQPYPRSNSQPSTASPQLQPHSSSFRATPPSVHSSTAEVGRCSPTNAQPDCLPLAMTSTANQPETSSGPYLSLHQPTSEIRKQATMFPQHRPIQLAVQDESLIRHFLDVLAPTSKAIEPQQPNFLLDLFVKSLYCAPLYDGIMAYSALHLSRRIDRPDLLTIAHSKHQRSLMLLESSWVSSVVFLDVELVLSTLVIYSLWEVSHGTTSQRMNFVFDMAQQALASANQTFASLPSTGQSCAIVLARLCFHSASFGARVPTFANWLLQSTFGSSVGNSPGMKIPSVYVDWLQLYEFAAQVSTLDRELQSFRTSLATAEQFDTASQGGKAILQRLISFKERLDDGDNFHQFSFIDLPPTIFISLAPDLLNLMYKSAFVNSLIIYLGRIIHCRPESYYSSKIITIAVTITQSAEDPSYHILPWCLLLAGLEASNAQDYRWISACFDRMVLAGWISTKPKMLMDQIREDEVKSGRTRLSEIILQSEHLVVL